MEEKQFKTIIFLIILVAGIWLWKNHNTIVTQESQISEYQNQLDEYQSALNEANNNIEEANSYIEDAQSYAWSSYQEMGETLDNLMTVETVSEP